MAAQDQDPALVARRAGLKMLARRPLTEAELRDRLLERGHDPDGIEDALAWLVDERLVDDRRLAEEFIATRAERLGHGRERLLRELAGRGVERAAAAAAWSMLVEAGDLSEEAIRRRKVAALVAREGGRLDRPAYRRVYNALLRAGFDASTIVAELGPHREFPEE
ncbi:MAG: hypothetical protein GWN46_17065 [Gammaproteobacteria bacterium]|nr:hypothetical protein [Gammaproteobacteria bacterium]